MSASGPPSVHLPPAHGDHRASFRPPTVQGHAGAVTLPDLRSRFPGLVDGWVRLDGPAGTLPVDSAIEAMYDYLCSPDPANTGGAFEASLRTAAMVDGVRVAVGGLLGAGGDQVIFGASSTALVFA